MNSAPDMRIPVLFKTGAADAAYLVEGDAPAPAGAYVMRFTLPAGKFGHAAGCACCMPRGPAAAALAAMFRARATGDAPFFARVAVLASAGGEAAVKDAIVNDVVSAARYRVV